MADPDDDAALLGRWRDGDADAGETLLARHLVSVHRFFASQMAGDPEELTQRTFEAVIAGRDRIADGSAFRAYLFGIARRQLATQLAQRYRDRANVPLSRADLPPQTSPSRAFARVDQLRLLLAAIGQLPDDVRPAVEMFYLDSRKLKAIATELGVPLGTVKSRLFRGRALLREALERSPADPEVRDSTIVALAEASGPLNAGDDAAD